MALAVAVVFCFHENNNANNIFNDQTEQCLRNFTYNDSLCVFVAGLALAVIRFSIIWNASSSSSTDLVLKLDYGLRKPI